MFSRISAGAFLPRALAGLPSGDHSPCPLPNAFDVSERDPCAPTSTVGE
jgi:hypothetical protein